MDDCITSIADKSKTIAGLKKMKETCLDNPDFKAEANVVLGTAVILCSHTITHLITPHIITSYIKCIHPLTGLFRVDGGAQQDI